MHELGNVAVLPGLVDMNVMVEGSSASVIRDVSRRAVEGGVTTIGLMPSPSGCAPVPDLEVQARRAACEGNSCVDVCVFGRIRSTAHADICEQVARLVAALVVPT